MCFSTFGQSNNVYKSAYFDSTNSTLAAVSAICSQANFSDNSHTQLTTEMWVKTDTTYSSIQTLVQVPAFPVSGGSVLDIHIAHDTITASYGNNPVICAYPNDTNWHHIAFTIMPAHTTGTDSLSLYIDGVFAATSNSTHISLHTAGGLGNIGIGFSFTNTDYFKGHIARFVLSDSVLYTSNFTPDCVFDTTNYHIDTLTAPTLCVIPLNGNDSVYYQNTSAQFNYHFNYTYMTSPCAPIDTIYRVADTLVAHNSNASYMKGAYASTHYNGWDTSLHTLYVTCPNVTFGTYTDKLGIDTTIDSVYIYHSAYRSMNGDTTADTTITILHNTTYVPTISKSNISIFPNPSTGIIHISATTPTKIIIYDIMGKLILSQSIDKTTEINLPKNTYIISANDTRYKIIVE